MVKTYRGTRLSTTPFQTTGRYTTNGNTIYSKIIVLKMLKRLQFCFVLVVFIMAWTYHTRRKVTSYVCGESITGKHTCDSECGYEGEWFRLHKTHIQVCKICKIYTRLLEKNRSWLKIMNRRKKISRKSASFQQFILST